MSNKPSQSFIDAYNQVRETPVVKESHDLVLVDGYGKVTAQQAHQGAEHHTKEAARHTSAGNYQVAINHLRMASNFLAAAHHSIKKSVTEEKKSEDDGTVRAHSISITMPDGSIKREVVLATGEKAAGRKAQKSAPRGAKVTDARVAEDVVSEEGKNCEPEMGRVASKFKRNQRMNSKRKDKEKQERKDDK